VLGILSCHAADAQELTPRAYWPAPTGTNVLSLAYQLSTGDIITDPSLPVVGVDSTLNYAQATYQRSFSLAGRTSTLQLNLPYTWGTTEGVLEGQYRRRDLRDMADMRARLTVNLKGAPAMTPEQFRALLSNPELLIGASLLVQAPTGGYDADRLINAGTNRWSAKPAVGMIWPAAPGWLLEAELGAWLFGDNDEFVGQVREQEPIVSSEFHLIKLIRPDLWISLDLNYYVGGKTRVDGVERADLQRNSRLGATLVYPFLRQHALRASASTGIVTETGTDFEMFSLAYFYAWR